MEMGDATSVLVNCRSVEVSNLLNFLKSGVSDSHISSISGITLRPQVGSVASMEILVPVPLVPEPSLESGVEDLLITL